MASFWIWTLLLALLAALFVLWPLRRRDTTSVAADAGEREELVLDLFNEHLLELETQLANGDLDQTQFAQLRRELELSLLEDVGPAVSARSGKARWSLLLLAVLLPLLTVLLYLYRGNIADVQILDLRDDYFAQRMAGNNEQADQLLDQLVQQLGARLQVQPDNEGNRYLLARSYMQQGDYVKAVGEFLALVQAGDVPASIVGELAQAVFLASGSRMTPEVELLAQRALQQDPQESTSLGLMGIAAFAKQDYARASQYWQQAVAQMDPRSPSAADLRKGIARAQELQGDQAPADTAIAITLQVSLAEGVSVPADTTVFVYARAWQGPRMPLAIQRLQVADLPATVTLDKSMAMAPGMDITSVPQLELLARVSFSGQPVPASGDWEGSVGPVVLADVSAPLILKIDQKVP